MTDLIVLAADKDIEESIRGLLGRHRAIGIRQITFDVITHPGRDPGCFTRGHDLLRLYRGTAEHALLLFDAAWEGRPTAEAIELEATVNAMLTQDWGPAARCVVIDPEIEQWVWATSPNVERVLGWHAHDPPLRRWLRDNGLWPDGVSKPPDPKAAFESCLREVRFKPSAALFGELARRVGIRRCSDPSFMRLLSTLREWFEPPPVISRESTSSGGD